MKTAMVDNVNDAQAGRRDTEVPVAATGGPLGWWARAKDFLAKVREEVGRVTWPTRDEVVQSTQATLVFVLVTVAFLLVVDAIFGNLISAVL